MNRLFDLQGKKALITGAGGLLGKEHARALLDCGAEVVLTGINEQPLAVLERELNIKYGEKVSYDFMDVTDKVSVEKTYQKLLEQNICINILINNAAIDPKVKTGPSLLETSRFEEFSLEDWNLQLNVGLTGAYLCSQVFGSAMAKKEGGVILNIASDLSIVAPDQRIYRKEDLPEEQQPAKPVSYSVIKTGLVGMTRYLAAYWAHKKVRVNALSPGGVFAGQDAEFVKKLTSLIPMGRMAEVDEYHGAIQFLCSDASKYMTGQNMVVNGGRGIR